MTYASNVWRGQENNLGKNNQSHRYIDKLDSELWTIHYIQTSIIQVYDTSAQIVLDQYIMQTMYET